MGLGGGAVGRHPIPVRGERIRDGVGKVGHFQARAAAPKTAIAASLHVNMQLYEGLRRE